jgi:hypothetical protein
VSALHVVSKIRPIIRATYGRSSMANALTAHLAAKIEAYDGNDRERMIALTCWDWFAGGTTAASTARKIEVALKAGGER